MNAGEDQDQDHTEAYKAYGYVYEGAPGGGLIFLLLHLVEGVRLFRLNSFVVARESNAVVFEILWGGLSYIVHVDVDGSAQPIVGRSFEYTGMQDAQTRFAATAREQKAKGVLLVDGVV